MSMHSTGRAASRAALFVIFGVGVVGALVSAIFGVSVLSAWRAEARAAAQDLTIEKAAGGTAVFRIELAQTDAEKAKGLMFRTKLGAQDGMLFPYGIEQEVTMWMRNTYIPLDMLFIRADGVIHRIEARTEPLSDRVIASHGNVFAVLEIAGGEAERQGIKVGDRVRHPVFPVGTVAAPAK